MHRFLSSGGVLLLFLLGSVLPVQAQEKVQLSRADFLQQAVDALYGEMETYYSVPFTDVPREAKNAVGLARYLGALRDWGRTGQWDAPVKRGEVLAVIFSLGQISPQSVRTNGSYRDLRTRTDERLARQALEWRLFTPLTERYFGWNRVVRSADLPLLLERFGARLDLPLALPATASPRAQPRTRTRTRMTIPSRSGRKTPEKTITIEFGGIDRGRSGSRRFQRRTLPRDDLLETIWDLIQKKFLHPDQIDTEETAYALAEKMIELLDDPYSAFLRPKSAESFRKQIQGDLSGIGAQVQLHPLGGVEVVTPLAGSPAMQAGIRPADRITHVNGESLLELNLQDAVELIRGPVGSVVKLLIERNGGKLTFTVVRDTIVLTEVIASQQDNVAVIKIVQFGDKTRRELTGILQEALNRRPSGIVLDLRNNPGGLLDAAIDVASHFLPAGAVVARIKSRDDERIEKVDESKHIVPDTLPMVVLVNRGSASASEIVAGALQDHDRATIIGQKTFGKGTVQEVVQFQSGESVKLTVAEWLTPNGRSIEKEGVIPDIEVEDAMTGGRDEMLLEAIRIIKAKSRK